MPRVLARLVLARDVQNPHPDRRQRHDWRAAAVIPAGTRISHVEVDVSIDRAQPLYRKELRSGPYASAQGVSEMRHTELYQALLTAAEPREATLAERLDEAGVTAHEVLEHLQVTDDQLAAAAAHVNGEVTGEMTSEMTSEVTADAAAR